MCRVRFYSRLRIEETWGACRSNVCIKNLSGLVMQRFSYTVEVAVVIYTFLFVSRYVCGGFCSRFWFSGSVYWGSIWILMCIAIGMEICTAAGGGIVVVRSGCRYRIVTITHSVCVVQPGCMHVLVLTMVTTKRGVTIIYFTGGWVSCIVAGCIVIGCAVIVAICMHVGHM